MECAIGSQIHGQCGNGCQKIDGTKAITALDLGHGEIINHSSADTAKFLNGWKMSSWLQNNMKNKIFLSHRRESVV